MKKVVAAFASLAALLLVSSSGFADAPAKIPVQGNLADAGGTPVDGTVDITVELFKQDTGGSAFHSESFSSKDVDEGAFTVYLGANESLDLSTFSQEKEVYAEVSVDGRALSPRLQLATAPYAAMAQNAVDAQTIQGQTPSDLTSGVSADWSDINNRPSGSCSGNKVMVGLKTDGDPMCEQIDSSHLADDAVDTKHIDDGAVLSSRIADGTIVKKDLSSGSVGSDEVKNQSLNSWDIGADQVDTSELDDNSVTTDQIKDGEVEREDMWWTGNCGKYEAPQGITVEKGSFKVQLPSALTTIPGIDQNDLTLIEKKSGLLDESAAGEMPDCKNVPPGAFCEGEGECSTDNNLNNVGNQDVYIRLR